MVQDVFHLSRKTSPTSAYAVESLPLKWYAGARHIKISDMDKEKIFERFSISLKVRLTGVLLTIVCLLLRIFVFPNSLDPLVILVPMVIAYVMSLFISALVTDDDCEISMEKYAEYFDEFERENKKLTLFLSRLSALCIIGAIIIKVLENN